MMDVAGLRALRSVAAVGTLAEAAVQLGFTASAVSQQIKRLEHQVGVALLAPAGRGVVLTPAGHAVANASGEVFHALENCSAAAHQVAGGSPSGVLRVAAFSTAIRGLLAPVLPEICGRYPRLQVQITEQDPDQALRSVDAGTTDLALVHDADGLPPSAPASVRQRLLHTDLGDVVMTCSHPLVDLDRSLTSADLVAHAWVCSPPGTVCHGWFRRLFADVDVEPNVRHLVDDFSSHVALVAAGDVLALLPRLARPALGEGLVARPLQRAPRREVKAAWRRSADASPAIQAVLTELGTVTDSPHLLVTNI